MHGFFLCIKYVEILTVFADTFNDKRNKCRRIVFTQTNFFIMQKLNDISNKDLLCHQRKMKQDFILCASGNSRHIH